VFLDGSFDDFGDESLGESTDFRMYDYSGREGTTGATNHNLVALLFGVNSAAD
jgi:hypothetical protein